MPNPLVSDRNVSFLVDEVFDLGALCALPAFSAHSRETFTLYLDSARKLAREVLFPAFKPMDESPPRLENGQVRVHPALREILPRLFELGLATATRPAEVGGQELPASVAVLASHYCMAANGAAAGYLGLTQGAAHLIEEFGDAFLRREFMPRMYAGEWAGTMALTEPQAGSSLADVRTRARPRAGGGFSIDGNKVFISGGDQDVTANIVHLTLARIEGAPSGIKGVSLFAIPKKRPDGKDNDCTCAGVFHKMGWRGLPSIALNFGERGDCRGWLVGEPNRGISYMFQMMNEARLMVGMNAVSTASAAYFEALEYAKTRPQGRPLASRDPSSPQVPIIEHADVRRMLLKQKCIVEGGLSLLLACARYADLSRHAQEEAERHRAALLLDLLTPVAKTFPAERGFESNALAVQVHGGYGYTSEYLPEAWLRDQKLNSIHEGTSGIQSMDLLGRKVVAEGGAALAALAQEVEATLSRAGRAGVAQADIDAVRRAIGTVGAVTLELSQHGLAGDREKMMLHAWDYMDLFSTAAVAWQWLEQAAAAREGLRRREEPFYRGKLAAAQHWIRAELPRVEHLAQLCRSGEDSYGAAEPDWF
ncbi:MAG TPA: acyl-CoA dehydrogenase [Myxococcales bacterium]|nr:acyl-CoA dehydrogenase [Myxococcales bacterium]